MNENKRYCELEYGVQTCLQYCSKFEEKLDVKNLSPSKTISVSKIRPFDVPRTKNKI